MESNGICMKCGKIGMTDYCWVFGVPGHQLCDLCTTEVDKGRQQIIDKCESSKAKELQEFKKKQFASFKFKPSKRR